MSNSYRNLREILHHLAEAEMSLIERYVDKMDDIEFREIPTILLSDDAKKVIETYGWIFNVQRKDDKADNGYKIHTIYCIFPSIFKVIV